MPIPQLLPARSPARRVPLALAAAGTVVLALPAAAHAHVEVNPESVEGGDFSVVAFRVPNERDDAAVTQLRVLLPKDQPLASVQTTAMPGWTQTVMTRKLARPIEMEGAQVDSVVSQVTWKATAGGVRPGQFEDFQVSLGQLPKSGHLVFTAVQTYSTGEQVLWNEVAADGAAEPEHPAPVLDVTEPAEDETTTVEQAGTTTGTSGEATTRTDQRVSSADDGSTSAAPTAMSAAALALALGAVVLAGLTWRRRTRA